MSIRTLQVFSSSFFLFFYGPETFQCFLWVSAHHTCSLIQLVMDPWGASLPTDVIVKRWWKRRPPSWRDAAGVHSQQSATRVATVSVRLLRQMAAVYLEDAGFRFMLTFSWPDAPREIIQRITILLCSSKRIHSSSFFFMNLSCSGNACMHHVSVDCTQTVVFKPKVHIGVYLQFDAHCLISFRLCAHAPAHNFHAYASIN